VGGKTRRVVGIFIFFLGKCTKACFSRAKEAPCITPHLRQHLCISFRVVHVSSVLLPNAQIFTSSTKPIEEMGKSGEMQKSTRSALWKRKRMGDK
jgi:hypothetical protein